MQFLGKHLGGSRYMFLGDRRLVLLHGAVCGRIRGTPIRFKTLGQLFDDLAFPDEQAYFTAGVEFRLAQALTSYKRLRRILMMVRVCRRILESLATFKPSRLAAFPMILIFTPALERSWSMRTTSGSEISGS